jgi:DNA-binding winged helix-turn-helix (wHTH) protein/tetratricopeptide (TPR) repeat protein
MQADQILTFDRYSVDLPNSQLWRGKRGIALTSQTFAVLRYLIEHAGQVVTKAELFAALWPNTVVTDGALGFCIVELRKALGDNAKAPRFIETVHRRGYRFLPAIAAQPVQSSTFKVQSSQPPVPNTQPPAPILVGREADLSQLHQWLAKALNGKRQIVFVTGEAGIGKTSLVEAFLSGIGQQATGVGEEAKQQARGKEQKAKRGAPSLTPHTRHLAPWISWGQCIEHYGPGEPYMPILEALGRLCRTPDGKQLVMLLQHHAPTWLVQLPSLLNAAELETLQRKTAGATRERMLREMGDTLDAITAERPLVLVLEDLHWSDASTLELLALLARRREPARLLVIGAYRPVDLIVQAHPLRAVKQELQLHGLCAELPLGLLSEAQVAEYLAQRVGVGAHGRAPLQTLAKMIHRRTDGNPLFMVTAVEDLVSQGMLISGGDQGTLPEDLSGVALRVPDTVQQLIEQQLARLNAEERRLLEAASVAGMEFSAAALAAGIEATTEDVEERCASLVQQGRFLRTSGTVEWPDGAVAARYSFLHALYQEALYNHIPAGRRQRLHQRIGERQETGYGTRAREIATELAMHFEQGRDYAKTAQYLQQAGENALRRSANREAIVHLTKGLELLKTLPKTPERSQQELTLQVTLSVPLVITQGYAALEVKATYDRAWALCRELGETPSYFFVLFGLSRFYIVRSEFQTASEIGEQLLRLAHLAQDPTLLLVAYMGQSGTLFFQGKFAQAQTRAEQGITLYDPRQHGALIFQHGEDPKGSCLSWLALSLWYLGYPDQGLEKSYQALGVARDLSFPLHETFSLFWTAFLHHCRGEVQKAQEQLEALMTIAQEQGIAYHAALGMGLRGAVLAEQGHREEGLAQIQQGLAGLRTIGQELGRPYFLALLAEAYGKGGQAEEGLIVLAEALDFTYKTGECMHQAELYRLKGELTLAQSSVQSLGSSVKKRGKAKVKSGKLPVPNPQSPTPSAHEAEECFRKALDIAQRQQAKALELRATMSLARLWRSQGKRTEAHQMLSEIYGWFTEGFDTTDLQEAKALLTELRD